ncbi:MAG TPA: imidazole glycerol phosphate synthase subunit HisH [Vitreimonas sp.]|uniref:imidazole glycerol phosphate synthase subunit HisH n=1 Tax=Vitreimonas sp. TaxID=3069702 RepID=UPI002D5D3A11|nr:imidazole glycerol phosphate synthase subunit HisH [Vitreimonas sp.]HYD88089.1 imidazole glycerol phosphate synthase subunit HisH [Vitreimonas sp.]
MDVVVVKLGVGNTASILFALERLGVRARLSADSRDIEGAERVILPGVGAAAHAMQALEQKGVDRVLRAFKRPLLGICLGQQLLYEASEEGLARGLALLPGVVSALPADADRPVPHMGWSPLSIERDHPLLEGVEAGAYVYFVHSYACPLGAETIASTEYGARFAAAVARDNFFGCQFHPERSGAVGARVLRNFLSLPC